MTQSSHSKCCTKCKKVLVQDEMAIYRRLVNRGAKEFLCMDCLADHFKCARELIQKRIHYFREMGCTLFK